MPPTRRARKLGQKRVDAALDALRSMGFADSLVRKTVRDLLKAYGGDDGWPFIEECSYKLLIDTILEELEKPENNEPKLLIEKGNNESKLLIKNGLFKDGIIHSAQPMDNTQFPLKNDRSPDEKLGAQVHGTANGDAAPFSLKDETSHAKLERQLPSPHTSTAGTHSSPRLCTPLPMNPLPSVRCRPCYGWLSSDDDEEPDQLVSRLPVA